MHRREISLHRQATPGSASPRARSSLNHCCQTSRAPISSLTTFHTSSARWRTSTFRNFLIIGGAGGMIIGTSSRERPALVGRLRRVEGMDRLPASLGGVLDCLRPRAAFRTEYLSPRDYCTVDIKAVPEANLGGAYADCVPRRGGTSHRG